MPNINIQAYDDFICDGCPMFEVKEEILYVGDEPYVREYSCKHLSFCEKVIPRVRQLDRDLYARMEVASIAD